MWVAFALHKLLTFFQQKISAYLRFTHVNFNNSLTNDVVSFEQLGPDCKEIMSDRSYNGPAHVDIENLEVFMLSIY